MSLFRNSRQGSKEFNLKYPIAFNLLNNKKAIISEDGIHFYNHDLTEEDQGKNISFESPIDINNQNDINSISMAQFDQSNDEYILILVKNEIYIFSNDHTLLNSTNLSPIIDGQQYSLIPYKLDRLNDFLNYFIVFIKEQKIYIKHFIFDLKSKKNKVENEINHQLLTSEKKEPNGKGGINCIFMNSNQTLI